MTEKKEPPYSEEQLRYLRLKWTQLIEEGSKRISEEKEMEEHDLARRGLVRSGMWVASKKRWHVSGYRLRQQSFVDAHLALWEKSGASLDKTHLEYLQEELKANANHEPWVNQLNEELIRSGNREEHNKALLAGLKSELEVCDIEIMRNAELLFFERANDKHLSEKPRGIQDAVKKRKPKIFISSDQKELEGERSAVKNKIELAFPRQFEIFLFERETPDSRPPQDFFKEHIRTSDIYIGIFKSAYSDATIEEYFFAKELGKETFLYFNTNRRTVEEPKLMEFREKIKHEVSYAEWNSSKDLEHSIVETLKRCQQAVKQEQKIVEKLVDQRWADEAKLPSHWRREGYELRWSKEEAMERRLNDGWVYVTSQDATEEIEYRYVTKDRLFLIGKKKLV